MTNPTYTAEQMRDALRHHSSAIDLSVVDNMLRQGAGAMEENAELKKFIASGTAVMLTDCNSIVITLKERVKVLEDAVKDAIDHMTSDGHEGQMKDCWMCLLVERMNAALKETK